MKYIKVNKDKSFQFKDSKINEILDTDIKISNEIYNDFFRQQSEGKNLRLKENYSNETFENLFEEYTLEPNVREKTDLEILKETVDILVLSALEV